MEIATLILLIILVIEIGFFIVKDYKKSKQVKLSPPFILEKYTFERSFQTIDNLIEAAIAYKLEEEIGDSLGAGNSSPEDLPNDVIVRINQEVQEYVITNISRHMREYLFSVCGQEYIRVYIRTKTLIGLTDGYRTTNTEFKRTWGK